MNDKERSKAVFVTPNEVNWREVALASWDKFVCDWIKYGDWSVLPRCEECGKRYPHFYISNEDWEEVSKKGVSGWICLACLSKHLGREPHIVTLWVNLFETEENAELLDKRLDTLFNSGKWKSTFKRRDYGKAQFELVFHTVYDEVIAKQKELKNEDGGEETNDG